MKKCICKNISINQAIELIKNESTVIIDVREREEFVLGNVKNSINIPLSNLKRDAKKFVISSNQTIIVYCSTGIRSSAACQILIEMGYEKVYNINGGVNLF